MEEYELKHLKVLDEYLADCMVLLKSNGDFPIEKPCSISLYGNGIRKTLKGGTGSGEVNCHSFINIEEAFLLAGFRNDTKEFLNLYDYEYEKAKKKFKRGLNKLAKEENKSRIGIALGAIMKEPEYNIPINSSGDLCIYVLSRTAGEGRDRKNIKGEYLLTDTEKKNILYLNEHYKKFMLVLNVGSQIDLNGLEEVNNILLLSQLGNNTSKALVDVILGKLTPSGKLSETWTKYSDYDLGSFGDLNDTN